MVDVDESAAEAEIASRATMISSLGGYRGVDFCGLGLHEQSKSASVKSGTCELVRGMMGERAE